MAVGLLPAAGRATRLAIASPKELMVHRGRAVIDHSVAHLVAAGCDTIVVVTRAGKEAVLDHLVATWPSVRFVEVRQPEPIGALIDALRAAAPALAGHDVRLLFPDTFLAPSPFGGDGTEATVHTARHADTELLLLCHDAAADERWRNFGVVDVVAGRVVEKPTEPLGSTWCWGAAWWTPRFTERLHGAATLTDAINDARWEAAHTIERYEDIGLAPGLARP